MVGMGVMEPKVLGKKYSWFQPNGTAASRIDRILLSQELVDAWCVKDQWIGARDVSDHCPMWLVSSNKNWGPKPFKFFSGWLKHKNGKEFMEEKWKECEVEGWMAHIVKEKLKYVKEKLKVWNKEVYGILNLNIEKIVGELNLLEDDGGEEAEWDGDRWKGLNTEFWAALRHKEGLLAQKARINWIQQGDGNTKFFHNAVKLQQRRTQMGMLRVEDRLLSGVDEIK